MTTEPTPAEPETQESQVDTETAAAGMVRQRGREFLVSLHTVLRSLNLYPVENSQVQRALDELTVSVEALHELDAELELRIAGEFIYINEVRLRLSLDNYATFSHVLSTLRECGVGAVRVFSGVERRELQVLLSLLLAFASRSATQDKLLALRDKLNAADISNVELEHPPEHDELLSDAEKAKGLAKRTYGRSVAVTKDMINSIRLGRAASAKKVKRAVQSIVDQVLKNEVSLVGLTTLRDYDEYTFTHSVNVCILSVSIGKRLGLTRHQLYDLGIAALLHDVGKSQISVEILNKPGALDDEEWRIIRTHPWWGVLTLFDLRGFAEIPYRAMIVAHQHHQRVDLKGYPKALRLKELSLYSRIVAAADTFDAATHRRSYRTTPIQPDRILLEMWEARGRGYETGLVKALINLLGIYPVGTCVILDSYEIAVVHAANPDPTQLHRPIVQIVCGADGSRIDSGELVDLAQTDGTGNFRRSIVKVTDPGKYGINPGECFV